MRPRAQLVSVASAVVILVGCGSSTPSTAPETSAVPTDTGVDGFSLNPAEIEFAQGMIAHHEQAIEMAEIALDPSVAAGAAVTDLATRIMAAQDPEIDLMTGWLTSVGASLTMDMSNGHDMSSMEGMMSADEMDALAEATGQEFDRLWLAMMIEHHEGAIGQSETVLAEASNAEVIALAESVIATQRSEIEEMRALLDG